MHVFLSKVGISVLCLLGNVLFTIAQEEEETSRKPLYKYRYETQDVMNTAASNVPVRGYHVVEGGYYPEASVGIGVGTGFGPGAGFGPGGGFVGGGIGSGIRSGVGSGIGIGIGSGIGGAGISSGIGLGRIGSGIGAGNIGVGGIGAGGIGAGGIGGGYIGGGRLGGISSVGGGFRGGSGFIGGGVGVGNGFIGGGGGYAKPLIHHHGIGGEYVDKKSFADEKKNVNDEKYEKASGKKGLEVDHGQEGFSQGKVLLKEEKGDNGYYNNAEGGKKVIQDGKTYQGGQHFDKEGKSGGEKKERKNHKKGHVIKGYKTSHHKDESGKTEEYYDEENDEGDFTNYDGKSGSFGEKAQTSYKGGLENGQFNSGEQKKQGHYGNEHAVDKSNADQGRYGQKKYAGQGEVYGVNNGFDEQSLLGHSEQSGLYKHIPYHHVPIFG